MVILNLFTKDKLLLILFISVHFLNSYPLVTIQNNNIIYKQVQAEISENTRRLLQKKDILPLQIYQYKKSDVDTIFTVSSRFNLSYETIATLNNIENQLFFRSVTDILIPTCKGIFKKSKTDNNGIEVKIENRILYFYPGESFNKTERLEFLITPFDSPILNMIITSEYGYRENPFTGIKEFHSGIDLKAKIGTKLLSPYKGVINNTGFSEFYGNYVIIDHSNGFSSHFYHLSRIFLKEGDAVSKGDFFAESGNSGKSTGPHLHFEIHYNGEPINPKLLLGNV